MRLWRRRRNGITTLTFVNSRSVGLTLWLEPWCDEVTVAPGSRVDLEMSGGTEAENDALVELTGELLAFYAPGGSRVRVMLDGEDVETASATISVPPMSGLGTRNFVQIAFGGSPEARPGGMPLPDGGETLAAAMADGDLRLEPMTQEHRESLRAACAEDKEIWALYATSYDPEHFDESFDRIRARPDWACFTIFLGQRLIGMSCYIGIDADRGVLEIGNTYYVPDVRGSGINRRIKDLMLRRAFGCGFRRVEFRVDARNMRSQAAMAKIGGVREGVLRADRITWTGHVRDTVLFSILAGEWGA